MKEYAEKLLASYIDALYPIIYINHFDFKTVDDLIIKIADDRHIVEYHNGLGIVNFENKYIEKECALAESLKLIRDDGYDKPMIIVLKDIHNQLNETEVIANLKYIAQRNMCNENYNATVFIVSSILAIPKELENLITVFDFPLPGTSEIMKIINEFTNDLGIDTPEDVVNEISLSLKGLNEFQIKQILNLAYQDGGTLDADDKTLILTQKEQLIKKAGLLEMIPVRENIDSLGGMENLKKWLKNKEHIFNQLDKAIKFGVDVPKGILIAGYPGCGKSLTAKVTANLFQIPLVRLDVGRLLGKYVGESEENMRRALALSEAISPCVLWIDEIEKAFSGVGSSNGSSDVTTRLFGQFLTWMQEKESAVFIVATANDISNIPPEFLRKGRFDELFVVELPKEDEQKKIVEIHLRKRNKWNKNLDISKLVKQTDGYSGADLESIVRDAIENCFIDGQRSLTTEDLLNSKTHIKSIKESLGKQRYDIIKKMFENMDLQPAYGEPDKVKTAIPDKNENLKKGYDKYNRESFEDFYSMIHIKN